MSVSEHAKSNVVSGQTEAQSKTTETHVECVPCQRCAELEALLERLEDAVEENVPYIVIMGTMKLRKVFREIDAARAAGKLRAREK